MVNIVSRLNPLFEAYLKASGFLINSIASLMFCVMLAANTYNVTLRSLFDQGTMWHQEISIMAAFWIYFAAYGILAKERLYISIEFLESRLSTNLRWALSVFVRILTILFHVSLGYFGVIAIKAAGIYQTPILGWSETIYFIPLLVGTADVILTEVIYLLRFLALPDRDAGDGASPVVMT